MSRSLRLPALAVSLMAAGAAAQSTTQNLTLVPGWNSVWLEVQPENESPAAVFGALPVEQVWCFLPAGRPVEFIDDPATGKLNKDLWRSWRPASDARAFLNDLGGVFAARPYLIKLTGAANATLTVTGTPVLRPLQWRADSFNLVGFPMDATTSGQLTTSFFTGVPELSGSQKYKLTPAGTWTALTGSDRIQAGRAYWIYASGAADFSGPLRLSAQDIHFGPAEDDLTFDVTNASTFTVSATVNNAGALPLLLATPGTNGKIAWTPLTTTALSIPAGETAKLRLGAQRAGLAAPPSGIVTISASGTVLRVPARIELPVNATVASGRAGLWVGDFRLGRVNDVNNSPTAAVDTPARLDGRLILHVNANGAVKLLKQVTLMKRIRPAGQPDSHVLITDDARLPGFTGATLKDGKPYGYRLSAIGYDFAGHEIALTGAMGTSLTGNISVPRSLPSHPMKHRYHPDHDDLDPLFNPIPAPLPANYTPDKQEVWDITRTLNLTFAAPSPATSPSAGYAELSGTYHESISGLHRQALIVEGTFYLRRINTLTELNPAP